LTRGLSVAEEDRVGVRGQSSLWSTGDILRQRAILDSQNPATGER
jgi:hypothetical protein